jgi:hypothetical protein
MPTCRVLASSRCLRTKDLHPQCHRPGYTSCSFRAPGSPRWIRPAMEWGIIGSSRGNVVGTGKLSRDAAQLGEQLLCKQPALNAVVYRTGPRHVSPQLSAVINPLPWVHFDHQSRLLDGIPEAFATGKTTPSSVHWSPNTPVGGQFRQRSVRCRPSAADAGRYKSGGPSSCLTLGDRRAIMLALVPPSMCQPTRRGRSHQRVSRPEDDQRPGSSEPAPGSATHCY